MAHKLIHGTVPDRPGQPMHVVRALNEILDLAEIDDIAERMGTRLLSKFGEPNPNVVLVHGAGKEALRCPGDSRAVNRVRTALFNAALNWSPLDID